LAFEELPLAGRFWNGEKEFGRVRSDYVGSPFFYEVEVRNFVKCPMALVDHVLKLIQLELPTVEAVKEYWSPTHSWNMMEILGTDLTIVRLVDPPTDPQNSWTYRFMEDQNIAKSLWPLSRQRSG
jgi:hypothetical protein